MLFHGLELSSFIRPILSLKYHRRLNHLHRMPRPFRHLTTILRLSRTKMDTLHFAIFHLTSHLLCIHTLRQHIRRSAPIRDNLLINHLVQLTTQANHRLGSILMPMDRHHRTRQQGIEHPLTGISRRCTQIEVLTQARILFSLCK